MDADIKKSYKFLRIELLVRWSHMRQEMTFIPKRYEKKFALDSDHRLICRLLEAPSFQLANSLYDQSFSEVLEFKNAEPDATTLRR